MKLLDNLENKKLHFRKDIYKNFNNLIVNNNNIAKTDNKKNKIEISESTLYPILRRLESAGFITTYSLEHQGRLRKMYKISEKGLEKIKDYLVDFRELIKVYNYIDKDFKQKRV